MGQQASLGMNGKIPLQNVPAECPFPCPGSLQTDLAESESTENLGLAPSALMVPVTR